MNVAHDPCPKACDICAPQKTGANADRMSNYPFPKTMAMFSVCALPFYEGLKHNSDSPARWYSTLAIRILHIVDTMHGQYDGMHAEHLKVVVQYFEVISRHLSRTSVYYEP